MLSRRIFVLFFTALVVISSSVFFNGTVSAESMDNTPVIQQQQQVIAQKQSAIDDQKDQITQLLQKKDALSQKLSDAQKRISDLNQQIIDKKAAADAAETRRKALEDMFVHVNLYAPDASGNLYAPGNCTWYVKSRRADIPNNLGNANTWYSTASAEGWNVGSAPKKGAVGTTTRGFLGHVVYVEGVSLDGSTVTISEMNYAGLYSLRTTTAAASDFVYIYELN